ncbi:leucine-rich repeat-containing protein 59 [Condylostylus longicornis]|uniref:leucine-rich repeat-containing protein 59 n=1 Tax=Condylostylus longicornis TaxID=2530218 RepID=UPI00244DEEFA|nr:leucine-rich repeat-containing protein 59 [Condylostylus longicornis]
MPKHKINIKDRVEDNTIDLSLSELTEVPAKDIASFKRVTNVDLSNNKIVSLGKNIGLLSHIVKLDLSKNLIKFLPDDFGSFRNLRHLDLYNNRLEHLPLSFGNLNNLRYLDLKANPLNPALGKIVGPCLTTKDCNEAAKNTVKFLKRMQIEFENAKQKLQQENEAKIESIEDQKSKSELSKKKKKKGKSKKSKLSDNELLKDNSNNTKKNTKNNYVHEKHYNKSKRNSNTALKTIFVFFFLLALNIFAIYVITAKNLEIVEKVVEYIPIKYRNLILSKTENMKLRISDYLQQFRTADEDHSYMKII